MPSKVQLTIGNEDIYPITDASVVAGLDSAIDERAVSTVSYDTTNKKITKTKNGTTTDVVTASTLVTDGGGIKNVKTVNNNSLVGTGNVSVGTITGITMNGSSKGTSGVVDLGTVITSHQSIKTVNNNTLTGTGNVSVGTVTSVSAGTGLSIGGTATVNPTVNIASGYKLPSTGEWGNKADLASPALTGTPTAPTATAGTNTTQIATTAFVGNAISNIPKAMQFKGSLGTGGTITSLPTADSSNSGWTYKVITAGTYASQAAKVGDIFISTGLEWVLIPSGDEPSGTVTSIAISATSPIAIDSSAAITTSGTRTISHANSGVTAGTYRSVTVNATGHVTAGTNPTTISGYGITDAKIASGTITLGSNTITPVTGPSSSTANHIATFSDATGKVLKDSGYTIATSVPSGAVFTDTKVTQSQTTANETYGVLLKNTTGNTDETNPVKYSSRLIFNPSTTRLGIGTTSPEYTLHVNGPSYSSASTVAGTYLKSVAGDVYVGNTSGSRCHQQYDSTNKCLKFIFD